MKENNKRILKDIKQSLINKENHKGGFEDYKLETKSVTIEDITQDIQNQKNIKTAKNVISFIDLFRSFDTKDFILKYENGNILLK